jgi:transcriptional regulator with PAS, ATPase and Fis domain
LETTIEHAISSASGSVLGIDDLPAFPEQIEGNRSGPRIPGSTIQEIEREAILRTLEQVGGSTTRAAKALNMSVRKIQYKLKEYRLAAASTLLVETIPSPPVERPVPSKSAVFVGRNDSSD